MKKQLLVLLSTMLLLTACGEDNNSTTPSDPSDSGSDVTPTPTEPAKIDVTIKVTAGGIDEYSGSHSTLWINSNFEVSTWNSHAMTQDSENENIWTYTFSQIEVDSRYNLNFWYGSDTDPDWSNGLNKEGTEAEPLVVTISESKTVYEFDATFVVPTVKHSFTLTLTPHIQTNEGKDDTMYDSTYVWMWCSPNETVKLTKNDGIWTYSVSEYVGTNFKFTPCLGTENAINWGFKYGNYDDGEWKEGGDGETIELIEGTKDYSYNIYFNSQPDEVTGDTYSVIWHYYCSDWTGNNLGSGVPSVQYKVNSASDYTWLNMIWDDTDTSKYQYTATLSDIPSGATVKYRLYTWHSDTDVRYLGSDTTGTDFEITNINSNLEYIVTGVFGATADAYGQGTATLVK